MAYLTLVHTRAANVPNSEWGFNSRDLIALTCWMQRTDQHGYRRVLIEGGNGEGGPEEGGYVLIYAPHCDWASWGIARSNDELVIWNCGSGVDLGRFSAMLNALESLPPVWTSVSGRRPALGNEDKARMPQPRAKPPRPAPRLFVVHSN